MRGIMTVLVCILATVTLAACATLHKKPNFDSMVADYAAPVRAAGAELGAPLANAPESNGAVPQNTHVTKISGQDPAQVARMLDGMFGQNAGRSTLNSNQNHAAKKGVTANAEAEKNEKNASAPAQSAAENEPRQAKASDRKVVYTGTVTLAVANKIMGRETLDRVIKKFNGLVVTASLDEVTFRVMPDQFEAAVGEVAGLGEVVDKQIRSEDVTAQYFDLDLRIQVAEGSRQRLMEILKKTGAVKDVLDVERDIRRLTEELEGMKGAMRKLADQIELATITVKLQEKRMVTAPRQHTMEEIFYWINGVGLDKVLTSVPGDAPLKPKWTLSRLVRGPLFRLGVPKDDLLPAGFLPVWYNGGNLLGVTARDNRLRVSTILLRQEKSDLDYWGQALEGEFKDYRGYIIRINEKFKLDGAGLAARVLRCETAVGNDTWDYDVWLIQRVEKPETLYVVEYARVKKGEDEQLPAVEAAVRGITVR